MKLKRNLGLTIEPLRVLRGRWGLAFVLLILLMNPWSGDWPATAQVQFMVTSMTPANGATNVSRATRVEATFNLPLVPQSVNSQTFLVLEYGETPVAGSITVMGAQAIFTPKEALPADTSFRVRIVGGTGGVRGSSGQTSVPLARDFFSSFVTGSGGGTVVPPGSGGMVVDPRTGAGTEIPPDTLKAPAEVSVITLDSASQIGQIDNNCDVPIRMNERIPDFPGFVRVSQVVRYEVQPCGTIAFGPGTRITLPLLLPLPIIGVPLRLLQLGRSGGELVFRETDIPARVAIQPGIPLPAPPLFGNAATVPDIQVFGTFAAFIPSGNATLVFPPAGRSDHPVEPVALTQQAGSQRLYFPVIGQTGGRQTRLSLANPDPSLSVSVRFTAYGEGGTFLGSPSRTISPNRQSTFLVSELFPTFTSGAIMAEHLGSGTMTGFSEIADNFAVPTMLGGAEAVGAPAPALFFPVIRALGGGFTEIHIFNPTAAPVNFRLAGFTSSGFRINPTNLSGLALNTIMLPPFGTLILSNSAPSLTYGVRLDFATLDGGYVVVQTTDGQALTGGELFGEFVGGQPTVAVLNGAPFPVGCLTSASDPFACHVDTSPESTTPSAIRRYTSYATHFENSPAESFIYLINATDAPTPVALSAFSELGQFRASFPSSDFLMLNPHQVFQASLPSLFGFDVGAGYVRVEYQSSSVVGATILRDAVTGRYLTAAALMADDPLQTQTPTTTWFSRLQLNSASAPQQTTGMSVFNPNNNSVQFRISITDASGTTRQSPVQSIAARSMFVRVRQSLSTLFPNINISSGFAQVQVTSLPGPGMGGRAIPVAVYRSANVVSLATSQEEP